LETSDTAGVLIFIDFLGLFHTFTIFEVLKVLITDRYISMLTKTVI
jgi:hypothetical protein